jgi:hypothetical protein
VINAAGPTGDGSTNSDIVNTVTATAVPNGSDSSQLDITVTLTADFTVPSYLDSPPTGSVAVMELLCYGLRYPNTALSAASGYPLLVGTPDGLLIDVDMATFSGVTVREPTVSRLAAGGYTIFGDDDVPGNYGSLYAQMDLPLPAGASVPQDTAITVSVPSVASASGTAFTPVSGPMQCYVGFSYVDAAAAVTPAPMRDRCYANDLTGDGSLYSDMHDTVAATHQIITGSPDLVQITVTLSADIPIDVFFSASQGALTPLMEVLCVDLKYPSVATAATASLPLSVTHPSKSYYTTATGSAFTAVIDRELTSLPIMRTYPTGYAVVGDTETQDNLGSAYVQMALPVAQAGKTLPAGT